MKELRRDSITNDLVILAYDRAKRPLDKVKVEIEEEVTNEYEKECPFCRENENLTTEETSRIEVDNKWITRSVYNKYPIIDTLNECIYGVHEVIIDTYRHNGSFYNMSYEEYEALFKMYKDRYISLKEDSKVEYITIFKNFLRKAGASLAHPHSQIMSISLVPPEVQNEIRVAREYYEQNGSCLYENIIVNEIKENKRIIHNGNSFLVLVPYASKYSGEIRILFKDKIRFEEMTDENIKELSIIVKKLFNNIYNLNGYSPFNICIHTHPLKGSYEKYFNVHIHIIPRKFNFGGFEVGSDMYVSSSEPEVFAQKIKFD